jgi:hypothetical protein
LAWHHFLRSLWGSAQDTAEAEGFATRLAELAEELGSVEMAVHGRSLLAVMARFSGRLDEATAQADRLQGLTGLSEDESHPWLGLAATYMVAVACGTGKAPPLPPVESPDPVVGIALYLIEAALTLGGRIEEGLGRLELFDRPSIGPFSDLVEMLKGLTLVLGGRSDDALPFVERAVEAGQALRAPPALAAAAALAAEITGTGDLPPLPASVSSIADALVLRAHAARGDATALEALRRGARTLVAPGLLLGL